MARLVWGAVGSRRFEIGIDRGVLYPVGGVGVPWNGLVSVTEAPDKEENTVYYQDGVRYLTIPTIEEFAGVIEAFTYPDEFSVCDGTAFAYPGVGVSQQRRREFGLSYRTRVGSDVDLGATAYKLHIVYNALVEPQDRGYKTQSEDVEALNFSWNFSTTPVPAGLGLLPTSHIVIDSTKINPTALATIESYLYGTESTVPTLLSPAEIYEIIDPSDLTDGYEVVPNTTTGLYALNFGLGMDLVDTLTPGLYILGEGTRLSDVDEDGLYALEI